MKENILPRTLKVCLVCGTGSGSSICTHCANAIQAELFERDREHLDRMKGMYTRDLRRRRIDKSLFNPKNVFNSRKFAA